MQARAELRAQKELTLCTDTRVSNQPVPASQPRLGIGISERRGMNWQAELRTGQRAGKLERASRVRTSNVPLLRGLGGVGGQSPRQPPSQR